MCVYRAWSPGLDHRLDPARQRVQHLDSPLRILAPCTRWHVKGMVGVREELQRRARAEPFDERLQKLQVCKLVAGTLQEEHRNLHLEEVPAALARRPLGRMQRKSE